MATRTVANGGGNFNATTTWVEGAVPTAADAVVFTATSGQLTVNVASVCLSIDFTNYVNTITFTSTLTVSGNVKLVTGFTQAGASGIIVNATSTLTSSGVTWSRTFGTSGTSVALTFADNWTVTNTVNLAATTTTLSGNILYCSGSLTQQNTTTISGTTTIYLNGTGTLTVNSGSGGTFGCNLTINTAGTITFSSTTMIFTGVTFTYTAGTIVMGASTTLSNNNVAGTHNYTFNCGGMTWTNISFLTQASVIETFNLLSNLNCSGLLTLFTGNSAVYPTFTGTGKIVPSGSITLWTGSTWINSILPSVINLSGNLSYQPDNQNALTTNLTFNVSGSFTNNCSSTNSGSGTINLVGSGTLTGIATTTTGLGLNLNINTSGTYTFASSTNFPYAGGTLTYTSGTVVMNGSTLMLSAAGTTTTLNTGSLVWNNVSLGNAAGTFTYVMSSNVIFSGTLQVGTLSTSVFSSSGTGKFVPSGSTANFTIIAATGDYSYLFNSGALALKNLTLSDGTAGSASQTLTFNGITFNLTGNLSWGFAIITGTSTINMVGGVGSSVTCIGPISSYPANGLRLNLTFNTSGTITISGSFVFNSATVTYTAGTVNATAATLLIGVSVTLNTGPTVQWGAFTLNSSSLSLITITINSLLYVVGTLTNSLSTSAVTPVFAGTSGFSTGTLTLASKAITFKSGNTYTVRSNFTYLGGLNQDTTYQFNSSTPGSQAYLTLNWGATCSVACLTFVDIDASGGRPIRVFTPISISGSGVNVCTLTNTKNIFKMTDLLTVGT